MLLYVIGRSQGTVVLEVGGLLSFATLGPDTLKELRAAAAGVSAGDMVRRFLDMHDLGDMLVAAGFADPVMDQERLTLTWASAEALLRGRGPLVLRRPFPPISAGETRRAPSQRA